MIPPLLPNSTTHLEMPHKVLKASGDSNRLQTVRETKKRERETRAQGGTKSPVFKHHRH